MAINRKMTRRPTHPGEILDEEFLKPMGLTQSDFAAHVGCDFKTINRIIKGHNGITAAMALRLSAALGTTPGFWLSLQDAVDLYDAERELSGRLPAPLLRECTT